MTIPSVTTEKEFQRSPRRAVSRDTRVWKKYLATKAALTAALVREKKSLRAKRELLQRQDILAQEFEHRLANNLQLIVGLLSLQSSAATTVEAAEQLTIAAKRVTPLDGSINGCICSTIRATFSSSTIFRTRVTTFRTCCCRRKRGAP
jgi:two-component sensor histidine kinase